MRFPTSRQYFSQGVYSWLEYGAWVLRGGKSSVLEVFHFNQINPHVLSNALIVFPTHWSAVEMCSGVITFWDSCICGCYNMSCNQPQEITVSCVCVSAICVYSHLALSYRMKLAAIVQYTLCWSGARWSLPCCCFYLQLHMCKVAKLL